MRSILFALFFIFFSSSLFAKNNDTDSGYTIRIISAEYGEGTQMCNATSAVQSKCNYKTSCSVEANNNLCGNPAPNVSKKLNIHYQCIYNFYPPFPIVEFVSADESHSAFLSC